ncbi:diguanylate cyclase domain-containing protein [Sulfurimonas sp.]
MLKQLQADEYLKNEQIQIYIRLFFIAIASISIYYLYDGSGSTYSLYALLSLPLYIFIFNVLYFFILRAFPYKFQEQRVFLITIADILLTVYVMSIVGDIAAYFAGALLWFSVGYGMRYGQTIGYIAYSTTLISWIVLITRSPFWIENRAFAIGWLLTFIIVPLYYFALVKKLHINIDKLHVYAQDSEHKALHDELTGLPNRALFDTHLQDYIAIFSKKNKKFALFFVDLDSFKNINDTYGHDIGDKVLVEASQRLHKSIGNAYRLGGDEFVSIAEYNDDKELENIAKNLVLTLSMPCKKSEITLSASIGISRFPVDGQSKFDLKKHADLAMYRAKESGKNRFCFYKA